MTYYSQCRQDIFLNEVIFKWKKKGVFLDIGANDGITYSNTYFFEKELEWSGLCIEPLEIAFKKLRELRSCIKINGCCSDKNSIELFLSVEGYGEMLSGLKSKYDPRHLERLNREILEHGGTIKEVEVHCFDINYLLIDNDLINIDFISIDTEGGELDILKAIDYEKINIKVVVVENPYNNPDYVKFMNLKGFIKIRNLDADEIFVNKKSFGFFTRLKFKNSKIK